MTRTKLTLYVDEELVIIAKARGLNLSEFVRQALMRELELEDRDSLRGRAEALAQEARELQKLASRTSVREQVLQEIAGDYFRHRPGHAYTEAQDLMWLATRLKRAGLKEDAREILPRLREYAEG